MILKIGSQTLPQLEEWTLQVAKDAAQEDRFSFSLQGSQTGADGEGNSAEKFVSKSGRVIIEASDWDVKYALALPGIQTVPEKFVVKWQTAGHFVDEFTPPQNANPAIENVVTLAQGLKNGVHVLEISGGPQIPLTALRIYRPSLGRGTQ